MDTNKVAEQAQVAPGFEIFAHGGVVELGLIIDWLKRNCGEGFPVFDALRASAAAGGWDVWAAQRALDALDAGRAPAHVVRAIVEAAGDAAGYAQGSPEGSALALALAVLEGGFDAGVAAGVAELVERGEVGPASEALQLSAAVMLRDGGEVGRARFRATVTDLVLGIGSGLHAEQGREAARAFAEGVGQRLMTAAS